MVESRQNNPRNPRLKKDTPCGYDTPIQSDVEKEIAAETKPIINSGTFCIC
jgi:hypothetical protein